jgi:phenylacetate-coenzyme A ligase PaaK-like adenylate-forming protein
MLEQRRRRFRSRAKRLHMLSVSTPLPDLVAELNEFQPAIVGGYPSVFALLAQEQQAGRLHIQPVLLTAGGETLGPAQRARITAAFGDVLHNSYGASEAIAITLECPHGWLHVNADWFVLEPVDREYRPTAPGQTSDSVLLTNLANRVQPIIRYELGDRVLLKPEPCACGSPLPAIQVEGRTDETLQLTTPDGRTIDLLPLALGTVVEETPGVYRFQVIQRGPARLCVRLEVAPDSDRTEVWAMVAQRLQQYLARHGLPDPSLELDATPPIPHPISGKLRQVWVEPAHSADD